ncbi:EF-hand domain-containing protein [Trichonephila clavata]|uniref:EF-hand domain-containing protein n=1 Tax=Trichonephila clavata TaxID=2740835 RepID=A0A8X6LQF3_TRICU|nr:EF-hand domain-containing protein [Trichonephila clavata]
MASDKGLQTKFELFCKSVGETEKKLSLENVKKWFRQAGILGDQKEVSDSDVSKAFSEVAKEKQAIDYSEVKELIGSLCMQKGIDPQELMRKLSGSPQESGSPSEKSGGPTEKSGGPPEKSGGPHEKSGGPPDKSGGPPDKSGGPPEKSGGQPEKSGGPPEKPGNPPPQSGNPQQQRGNPQQQSGNPPGNSPQ